MYNVTNRGSFEQLTHWLTEAKENCVANSIFVLVGNQTDRTEERKVTHEEGVKFMKDNGLALFFETSAFSGENIEKAFQEAAKLIFINYVNSEFVKGKKLNGDGKFEYGKERKNNTNENSCCY